jgi:hypothetical protein
LKKHYCGESPFGNGPDESCDLQVVGRKPTPNVNTLANYQCDWNEKKQEYECHQGGQPPAAVRAILLHELHRLGLPANANGETTFSVWKSTKTDFLIARADYRRVVGSDIELCQVIVIIDGNAQAVVVRQVPFQKTDVDVPSVTRWSLVDLADVDGDGNIDIVLEGDAYEDHWLEVVSMRKGLPQTIFSGLGYYL